MRFILVRFSAILLSPIFLAASANAAVFEHDWKVPGDGLLTYDDVNWREWLDLTETQLFKYPGANLEEPYQAVLAETTAGGEFAEFLPAMSQEVFSLAESAGIDTATTNFDVNQSAISHLVQLLGGALGSVGGLSTDQNAATPLVLFVTSSPRDTKGAGLVKFSSANDNYGVWLYRQVPEPSTAVQLSVMFVLTLNLRRRQSGYVVGNRQLGHRPDFRVDRVV